MKDKSISNYEWQDNFVMAGGLFDMYLLNQIFIIKMIFYVFVNFSDSLDVPY